MVLRCTILHDMLFCLLLFLKLLSLKTLKGVNKKCTIIFSVEKIGFIILKSNLYFNFLKILLNVTSNIPLL